MLISAWALRCHSKVSGNAKASKRGTATVGVHAFLCLDLSKCLTIQILTAMKEFIIIAGTQNAGKTTSAWALYQRLFPYSKNTTLFVNGQLTNSHGEVVYNEPPYETQLTDFKAILHIYGYIVAIISGGDYDDLLEDEIESVIAENADFIVISLRSINRAGSSRRMLKEKYSQSYTREFWVPEKDMTLTHPADIVNHVRPFADRISNYILYQTEYNQLT